MVLRNRSGDEGRCRTKGGNRCRLAAVVAPPDWLLLRDGTGTARSLSDIGCDIEAVGQARFRDLLVIKSRDVKPCGQFWEPAVELGESHPR